MRHREVCPASRDKLTWYGLHEVYYDENGSIKGWTQEAINPYSEDVAGLRWVLNQMTLSLDEPILDFDTGEEIE